MACLQYNIAPHWAQGHEHSYMNKSVKRRIFLAVGLALGLLVVLSNSSCDTLSMDDEAAFFNGQGFNDGPLYNYSPIYTYSFLPVVLDPRQRAQVTGPFELLLLDSPNNGTLELLDVGIFLYVPDSTFLQGGDTWVYAISEDGQGISYIDTVEVLMNTPTVVPVCTGAVGNVAFVAPGNTIDMDVLANDTICTENFDPATVQLLLAPGLGVATVQPNGAINYRAGTALGLDYYVYQACTQGNSPICNLAAGLVYVTRNAPQTCQVTTQADSLVLSAAGLAQGNSFEVNVINNDMLCGGATTVKLLNSNTTAPAYFDIKVESNLLKINVLSNEVPAGLQVNLTYQVQDALGQATGSFTLLTQ